ncbi:uncharacterized protein LOC126749733, partial [Anthonomus grandis grandis]|uniref:uncharacterized protein LOC126749733 n=1 Tax=Anthonomus grandis grandis TaxID=2921223 RepID=UPI002165DE45
SPKLLRAHQLLTTIIILIFWKHTFIYFLLEPQILRIETTTAPKPSQPEVVLSDVDSPVDQFLRNERASENSYKRENTVNGDQSDAHMSTLSQSSKEDRSISEGSPKKDKKKKKGLRTPSFLKKKKEKKSREA